MEEILTMSIKNYFHRIDRYNDRILNIEKDRSMYKRKIKEQAECDANYEGYYKGTCFRKKNNDVYCIVDINYKRYVLFDDWIYDIIFTCKKVNNKGYFDKRATSTETEILRGIEKILHENQDITCKEVL